MRTFDRFFSITKCCLCRRSLNKICSCSSCFLARSRKSAAAKKKEEKEEDEKELSDEVSSQEERGEEERGGRGDNDGQNISQNQVSIKTQIKL